MGFEHSFFKVIRSSEKMEVPPAFVCKMGGAPCILRDGSKNVWLVEMSSQDDKWFFHKGWAELFREKSLNVGDILLFEYLGNNLFHFKLFGEGESTNLGRGEQEEEEEEHQESEHSEEDDDVDDDDYVEEDEDDDDDDDDDYVKEEEDDVGECARKDEQLHISKKIKTEPLGDETLPSKGRYKKQKIQDCYGEEIFKSGLASCPDNPYFVSRSRGLSRKNELYIPKDVIVDYQLNIPEKMHMVDERGRKWEATTKHWKDGRVWCTKGWKRLCRVNKIKSDDICICEFQGRDANMSLHIHVLDKLL